MKLTLPIYYTIERKRKKPYTFLVGLNWYRNTHYALKNKVKKHYHELVTEKLWGHKFNSRIFIRYKIYIKRRNTDFHNIRSIVEKFFLDWLTECWAIIDDSFDYVWGTETTVEIDKENPRCEIEILIKN